MQLLIDIPEDVFKRTVFYREFRELNDLITTIKALEKAVTLPKGHGDLVDRNAIEVLRIGNTKREYDKGFDAGVSCMINRILDAPTIIEADKESD